MENLETHRVDVSETSDVPFMRHNFVFLKKEEEAQSAANTKSSGELQRLKESTLAMEEEKPNEKDNAVLQKMTIQTATETFDIVYMEDQPAMLSQREDIEVKDEVKDVLSAQTDGKHSNLLINQNFIDATAHSNQALANSSEDLDERVHVKTETVSFNVDVAEAHGGVELPSSTHSAVRQIKQPKKTDDVNPMPLQKSTAKNRRSGEKVRKCKRCDETFTDLCELTQHKKTHAAKDKSYKCDTCSASFHFKYRLEDHINMHLGIHAHDCTICQRKFSSKGTLRIHMKKHLGTLPFKCALCSKIFADRVTLEKHEKIHEAKRPEYKCDKCDKTLASAGYLANHMKTHAAWNSQPVVVPASSQSADLKTARETFDIEEVHREEGDEKGVATAHRPNNEIQVNPSPLGMQHSAAGTPICNRSDVALTSTNVGTELVGGQINSPDMEFSSSHESLTQQQLSLHLTSPPNIQKSHGCATCGKTFASKAGMKSHRRQHRKFHRCNICNASFPSKYLLSAHENVHTGIKPYDCYLCKRKFTSHGSMRSHFSTKHKGLYENLPASNLHICSRCGQAFASVELLRQHIKVHRRLRCPYCPEAFTNDRSLEIHTARKHLNIKLYKCFLCPESFSLGRNFTAHARSKHMEMESYRCRDCGKPFKHPENLKKHVEKLHSQNKGKVYGCNHCEASFVNQTQMLDHLSKHLLHKCAVCGVRLATFICLKKHMDTHSETAVELNTDILPVEMAAQEAILQDVVCYSEDVGEACDPGVLVEKQGLLTSNPDDGRTDPKTQLFFESAAPCDALQGQEDKNINLLLNSSTPTPTNKSEFTDLSAQLTPSSQVWPNEGKIKIKIENQNDFMEPHANHSNTAEVLSMRHHTDLEFLSDVEEEQSENSKSSEKFQSLQEPTANEQTVNESRSYKCDMCDASFVNYSSFSQHRRRHSDKRLPECHICRKKFTSLSRLKLHIQEHMGRGYFPCTMCQRSFAFASQLKIHQRYHSRKCSICDAGGFTRSQLKKHKKTHARTKAQRYQNRKSTLDESTINAGSHEEAQAPQHSPPEIGSKGLDDVFLQELTLPAVINSSDIVFVADQQGVLRQIEPKDQEDEVSYVLTPHTDLGTIDEEKQLNNLAPEFFSSNEPNTLVNDDALSLMPVLEKEDDYAQNVKKSHTCDACQKTFASESLLNAHTKRHRLYECNVCLGTYRSSYSLRVHSRKHMAEQEKRAAEQLHFCTRCDETFESARELTRHRAIIHSRHKCPHCSKTFADNPSLNIHIVAKHSRSSSGSYNCFLCTASFTQARALESHARSQHMEMDPCKCMECHKTFKHPASIKVHADKFHARNHGKIYGCRYCDIGFLGRNEILDHLKEHLLHKCAICGMGYATFLGLKHHMETHSEDLNGLEQLELNTDIAVEPEAQEEMLKDVSNYSEDTAQVCNPSVLILKQEELSSNPDSGRTKVHAELYFESTAPSDVLQGEEESDIPKISDDFKYLKNQRQSADLPDQKSHADEVATNQANISIKTENQNQLQCDNRNCIHHCTDRAETAEFKHSFENVEEMEEG